ncbi:unnamed protein product [Sphacelaria rigidula]
MESGDIDAESTAPYAPLGGAPSGKNRTAIPDTCLTQGARRGPEGSSNITMLSTVPAAAEVSDAGTNGCSSQEYLEYSSMGVVDRRTGRSHGIDGPVAKRRCATPGCPTIPKFAVEGSENRQFCVRHKTTGMVNVFRKVCEFEGCSRFATYGMKGGTRIEQFCAQHAPAGMVHLYAKTCGWQDCRVVASFGPRDSKKAERCSKHKVAGMLNVLVRRCAHQGCYTQPSYGVPGSRKALFCSKHSEDGMVSVLGKDCFHEGCSKRRSYGMPGSRKVEFCAEHAPDGMVNLAAACMHDGCFTRRFYGVDGSRTRKFCKEHALEGMVAIPNKRSPANGQHCRAQDCSRSASYGMAGSKTWIFCSHHATDGMLKMVKKRCSKEGCAKQALSGVVGAAKQEEFCGQHKEEMVNEAFIKCSHSSCTSRTITNTRNVPLSAEHTSQETFAVEGDFSRSRGGSSSSANDVDELESDAMFSTANSTAIARNGVEAAVLKTSGGYSCTLEVGHAPKTDLLHSEHEQSPRRHPVIGDRHLSYQLQQRVKTDVDAGPRDTMKICHVTGVP